MNFNVVILSRNLSNLGACVGAVLTHEPQRWPGDILVVDDCPDDKIDKFCLSNGLTHIEGVKPFIFARNANLGLTECFSYTDTAILLNDDALLKTKGGFTNLWRQSIEYPKYGILASSTNVVGNPNQIPQGGAYIRQEPRMLCFVCVLITRQAWLKVGPLDERYCLDHGCEDGDYCYRVRQAGLRLGIVDACYVDHGSLQSTGRAPGRDGGFQRNKALFEQKWGVAYESVC
jgi:hypothetical protein